MKVFLTGGSGTIGSAVIPALVERGHEVTALARSDDAASKVEAAGATAVRGELTDSDVLRRAAADADAAISVASPGDESSPELEGGAAAAIQDGLGPGKLYVETGGVWVYGTTDGEVDEDAELDPPPIVAWRDGVEKEVFARGNASLVMPAVVYGAGPGILELTFGPDESGAGRYPGDGRGHVTVVHAEDLGRLYALVVEQPPGLRIAGVTQYVTGEDVAKALSPGGEARGEPDSELEDRLGPMAAAMALDQRVSGSRARGLGWEPQHTDVLAELRA